MTPLVVPFGSQFGWRWAAAEIHNSRALLSSLQMTCSGAPPHHPRARSGVTVPSFGLGAAAKSRLKNVSGMRRGTKIILVEAMTLEGSVNKV